MEFLLLPLATKPEALLPPTDSGTFATPNGHSLFFLRPLSHWGSPGVSAKAPLVLAALYHCLRGTFRPPAGHFGPPLVAKKGVKNACVAELLKRFSRGLEMLPIHCNGQERSRSAAYSAPKPPQKCCLQDFF